MALVLVAVVAASEAAIAATSRYYLSRLAGRGNHRAERLHAYAEERTSTLAALAVARNVAVVVAVGLIIYSVTRAEGHSWAMFLLTATGSLVAVALADALPRLFVTRDPDRWGIRLVGVVRMFRAVFGPVANAINSSLGAVVRSNGEDEDDETEDILRLAEIDHGEQIEEDERQMIRGIIGLEETTAREIMVPRIDVTAVDENDTLDDALRLIVEKGYSRIPLYQETIDSVVGIVYAKDLLRLMAENRRPESLKEIARPPYFIPESKRVDELLTELKKSKVHIAVVVDEYGGTAGIVTIEDLLEEIVGEIQDEYDREEAPIERVNETEAILDARVSIDALDELFDFVPQEQDQDYDTVGGFVYHHLGKVPVAGDEVRVNGLTLRVLSVLGRRIKKVRATKRVALASEHSER